MSFGFQAQPLHFQSRSQHESERVSRRVIILDAGVQCLSKSLPGANRVKYHARAEAIGGCRSNDVACWEGFLVLFVAFSDGEAGSAIMAVW